MGYIIENWFSTKTSIKCEYKGYFKLFSRFLNLY